jgi:uncharacterized protein YndB with AHSA1/START domain
VTKKAEMSPPAAKQRTTILRTFKATIEEVWELWTTKDGIESWWGPEGFMVKVQELDLRPGGVLRYQMIAVAPEMVAFMKRSGMPATTDARITYTEVTPFSRLAYINLVDFVPGVAAYDVATLVELRASDSFVKVVLTLDAMHDEEWTKRAVMGWEAELGKLAKVLEAKGG